MLDIPEEFYNKLREYVMGELCSYIEYIIDPSFNVKPGDEPNAADIHYYDELDDYLDTGYIDDLRKLFADYIVK